MKKVYIFLLFHLLIFSVYNMGHPVTPLFLKNINSPTYMTGILLAAMALAQFVFAPIVGSLSDKYGRYILVFGPIGYALGQLGFLVVENAIPLTVFRFISGAFSVMNVSINMAYLTDITPAQDRKKFLGYGSLMLPLATFGGFIVGGQLGSVVSAKYVFLAQAICSLLLAVIIYPVIKNSKTTSEERQNKKVSLSIFKNSFDTLKKYSDTPLAFVLFITLLNVLSLQLLTSQTAQQLTLYYNFPISFVGKYVATISLVSSLLGLMFQNKIFRFVKNTQKLLPILSAISFLMATISYQILPGSITTFWLCSLVAVYLNTIFVTVIQDLIVNLNKDNDRGALLGLNQSSQAMGMFIGTIIAGFAFSTSPFRPVLLASIAFLVTLLYNLYVLFTKLNTKKGND